MTEPHSPLDFDGQVAIVTGAGAGIGRATALELARRGAKLLVNDYGGDHSGHAGSAKSAEAVVCEIEAAGGTAIANIVAVGSAQAANAIVEAAQRAFGRVDILVNNAGVTLTGALDATDQDGIERIVNVNLWGAYHMMRAVWPLMSAVGGGRIVNFTSNAVMGGYGHVASYAASKGGIWGLTADAAAEGRPLGILVNAIVPIAFTRLAGSDITGPTDAFSLWLKENFAPDRIAPAVAYLASRANADIFGEFFSVGGGRMSRIAFVNNDGVYDPALSAEIVQANIGAIRNLSNCTPVTSGHEEMARYRACHPFSGESDGFVAQTSAEIERNT